jgi:outer membrane protein OmpU
MKKILFATTALVATASVAAADVSFSGYGRFGAISIDNPAPAADVEGIYTRIRLQIDMTTEADNGLTFGARLRHQATSVDGAGYGGGFNGARFFARAGGLEVGVGNIFGAIEWMPGVYFAGTQSSGIGLSGLGFHSLVTNTNAKGYFNWDAYSSGGAGADGVEVMYSAGDFGGHLSYSNSGWERIAAHVSYNFNDWTVALGYQDSDVNTEDKVVLTVGGKIGMARIGLAYADNDGVAKYALKGSVDVGAATRVDAYIASEDGIASGESYGIAVSHALGGGASLEAGYSRNDFTDVNQMDLGIRFNF